MSKKTLKTDDIANELSGASLFFQQAKPSQEPGEQPEQRQQAPEPEQLTHSPTRGEIGQPTSQLTKQSANQSTSRLTKQLTKGSRVLDRPKAFYITERLDRRLDEAVRYLQENHGIRKVDRSTVVNALLDNEANWTEEALDLIVDRVISQLTSRLTEK
jgi:hypothetical protein